MPEITREFAELCRLQRIGFGQLDDEAGAASERGIETNAAPDRLDQPASHRKS